MASYSIFLFFMSWSRKVKSFHLLEKVFHFLVSNNFLTVLEEANINSLGQASLQTHQNFFSLIMLYEKN